MSINLQNIINSEVGDNNLSFPYNGNIEYRPKILIADDDLNNIKWTVEILSKINFQVLKAYDGQQALDISIKYMPDLIILDIMMPIYNGFEVARMLKAIPSTQNIPIIMVTAYCELEIRKQAIDAGADEFLSSPVNPAELLARVSAMLRLKIYQEQANIRRKIELNFLNKKDEMIELCSNDNKYTSILLVEDHINDIKLIQAIFHDDRYKFTIAETGEKAIFLIEKQQFDLVILDILLPDINGFEICRRIKLLRNYEHIPIIFISSLSDKDYKIKCLEFEADDFFVKPVDVREFKAKVKLLLRKRAYLNNLQDQYQNAIYFAIKDGLTGLYKRTYFIKCLDQEIKRSFRHGTYLSIMMIDIDNFKTCNDILGHLGGDAILCQVGKIILNNIREIDIPARYGGEEFIVMFPNISKDDTLIIAKRIQSILKIQSLPTKLMISMNQLTVSIGIADFSYNAKSVIELINNADQMLYKAKKTGKNKVCLYTETEMR